jgi:glycosyltransferase involved in cell wall biosynthesis
MKIDKWATADIKSISVVIPVYNEALTVRTTLESIHKVLLSSQYEFELLIVESNSTDGSREIVEKTVFELNTISPNSTKLILQDCAKGKGSAVREALKRASGDAVSIYDADDEYIPEDVLALVDKLKDGTSSFILGSRHSKGNAMRVMDGHKILSVVMNTAHWVFTFIFNITLRVRLTDPFTMHKVFILRMFDDVELIANRFDIDWEILGKAIRLGSIPTEIPIQYKARSYAEGKKVRIFLDPIKWIIILLRIRFMKFNRV